MSISSHRRARPVALAFCGSVLVGVAIAAVAPVSTVGAADSTRTTLVLDDQTQWVSPPAAGAPASFDLDLAARGAPAGAEVSVELFPRLDSRDHFEDTVSHGPRGYPISEASPVALSHLPATKTSGGVDLDLQIVTGESTGGGQQLGLSCGGPTGTGASTCTGVYPVQVSLLSSGSVLRSFTTFLTYATGASATPLDVAWVVPVRAPVSIRSGATRATDAVAPLTSSQVDGLGTLVDQLRSAASVPVTVDASPQTLDALDESGPDGRAVVTTLATISADQSTDEVPPAPYVPVDLSQLAGAGESTEIKAQMVAGATVLHALHVQTSPTLPWVAGSPVGNDLAGGLSEVGASDVVVPDASLAATPDAPSDTWASTFQLALGSSAATTVDAAETDTFLDDQFRNAGHDPALAASQVLADLAMVHFERPNTPTVRGLVAVPSTGWVPNATFDRVLLSGLDGNPVVTPVTLSRYFATVSSSNGDRTLDATGSGPVLGRTIAHGLSTARLRLTAFDSSVVGKPAVLGELDHVLLATESDDRTGPSASAALGVFERVLSKQLHLVAFSTVHTFTLTARTGVIPITIESQAPYTIVGTLSVSGAKFLFPDASTHTMRLDHATNSWRVNVVARSSGDLPLHVELTSRSGSLVIAEDDLTVRSTATSLVGVVLTVLALAVLLAWWARTWMNRRRRRGQPTEPTEPEPHVHAGMP